MSTNAPPVKQAVATPAPKARAPRPVFVRPELQIKRTTLARGHWRYFISLVATNGQRVKATVILSANHPICLDGAWYNAEVRYEISNMDILVLDVAVQNPKVELDVFWKEMDRHYELHLRGPEAERPALDVESSSALEYFTADWTQPGMSVARLALLALVLVVFLISLGVGTFGSSIYWIAPLAVAIPILVVTGLVLGGNRSMARNIGNGFTPVCGTNNRLWCWMFVVMILSGALAFTTARGPEAFSEVNEQLYSENGAGRPADIRKNLYDRYEPSHQALEVPKEVSSPRNADWVSWDTRMFCFFFLFLITIIYIPFALGDEVYMLVDHKAEKWMERGEGSDADSWFNRFLIKRAGMPRTVATSSQSVDNSPQVSVLQNRSLGLPIQFLLEVLADLFANRISRRRN